MKKVTLLTLIFFLCLTINYAQPGQLDPSFGTNGIVRTEFGKGQKEDIWFVGQVLVQPDKSMFVTFNNRVTKRHPDGSADSSFGRNGFSSDRESGSPQIAIQPDSKIVSLAYRVEQSEDGERDVYYFYLNRYNADASRDTTFKGDKTEAFEGEFPDKIVIQNDGKILVFGDFGFFRFNSDGSRDATFSADVSPSAIVIQNDGKIVGAANNEIVRYNTDGRLDNTFSGDGRQATGFYFSLIDIQKDGKIVIAGDSTQFSSTVHFAIARYNTDGSLDNTFSGDGKLSNDFGNFSMKVQDDGKIIVTNFSGKSFSAFRYNSDGSMDNSYNANRNYTTDFEISTISIQSNGEIMAAGSTNGNLAIAKYDTEGSLDITFDNDGKLYDSLLYSRSYFKTMAVHSNGKFAAVGASWESDSFYVVQYNSDGTLDKTFSEDGVQAIGIRGLFSYNLSAAYQSDGKLLVGGTIQQSVLTSFIFRYNVDGRLDTSFHVKQGIGFNVTSISIQPDGKIIVAGYKGNFPYSKFALARFNTNGTLDSSFSGGKIVTDFSKGNDMVSTVAIQSDGKIVVAGSTGAINFDQRFAIARYNPDGSLDKTFSDDGKQTSYFDSSSYVNFITSIAIQSDGKIVAAGSVIARYNTDGSLDRTFSVSGLENRIYAYFYRSVAIQNDNKIIVGVYTSDSRFSFIRFKANGSLDTTFGVNGKTSKPLGELNDMAIINNKLYAVGGTGDYYSGGSGIAARFLLDDENNPPTVNLSIPYNIVKYSAPARIKLNAAVANVSGKITKVQFNSGSTLLHTEDVAPYGFLWIDVPAGNYTLTAKAFDERGNVVTSNAINVSVADENVPPVVNIVSPVDDTTYTGPATIRLIANAKDPNNRIGKVEFYNGTTLLRTEYYYPYTYTWTNVQPGTYTITAKAYDDKGLSATSEAVTLTVNSASLPIVRSKALSEKTDLDGSLSVNLSPNPARSTLQIFTKGLQLNKPSTISVISATGVVMKTIRTNSSNQVVPLDVSSLASGVYTIKVISGDKILYKPFVKL